MFQGAGLNGVLHCMAWRWKNREIVEREFESGTWSTNFSAYGLMGCQQGIVLADGTEFIGWKEP